MNVATKFVTTTSVKLSSIPVVDGQVIALSDRNAWFYDMDSVRHSVTGNVYATGQLPATGASDTLYILHDADSNSGVYIWDGTQFVKVANNVEYTDFVGATAAAAGSSGLVPAPTKGDQNKFLAGDGSWKDVETTDTKNTVGSTNSTGKLLIVGAESQADSTQSYTNTSAYVDNGKVFSNGKEVVTLSDSQALTNKTYEGYTLGNVVEKSVASAITENNTDIPTAGQVHSATQKVLADAKAYTNEAISGVVQFSIQVVDALPASDIKENTIYLVPSETTKAQNVKTEYLYINGQWEIIGSTQIDLSGYSTTEQMNTAISTAVSDLNTAIENTLKDYVTTEGLEAAATAKLPPVATSGSYNDLTDKPTIPSKFSDLVQDKVLLTDDVTGKVYQLGVSNGKICITEVV